MNPILPGPLIDSIDDDRPRHPHVPVDWETRMLSWLSGLTAVALVAVAWFLGQHFGEFVAPTIVELQSRFVDSTSSGTPSLPPLPDSPFSR